MFSQKLEDAVKDVGGARAAILMGFDGIQVDSFTADEDLDIETVGMEFSVVLKEVRKAAELLEAGETEEMTVRTNELTTVVRVVNKEYFLALAINSGGNLGKGRYVLRVLAPQFAGELV